MRKRAYRGILVALAVVALAVPSQATENYWFHVTVDEGEGAKVTVNLPLALAEKALPMLPFHEEMKWSHHAGAHGVGLDDVRELWAEVKASPDMTFVTVQEDDETVKVWKAEGFVFVEVRDEGGSESVDVRVPIEVVDALVGGREIDFAGAIQALAERGGGDLVSVRERDDNIRVWIDQTPEARTEIR